MAVGSRQASTGRDPERFTGGCLCGDVRLVHDAARRSSHEAATKVEVQLGALDAPDQLTPTYELWIVRRESWLPPFPVTRRYERDREEASPTEDKFGAVPFTGTPCVRHSRFAESMVPSSGTHDRVD